MASFKEYLIPFLLYLATPFAAESCGFPQYAYPAKIIIVGASLIFFWKSYSLDFKDKPKLRLSVLAGAVIFVAWILIEQFMPYSSDFSPSILNIAFKFAGSILIAPLVEELFTRKFFLRFLINPDKWDKIAPKFTWLSFITLVH